MKNIFKFAIPFLALGAIATTSFAQNQQKNNKLDKSEKITTSETLQKTDANGDTVDLEHAEEVDGAPSLDELVEHIKEYVSDQSKDNNGYFPVYDARTRKNLNLKLTDVEKKHVSRLENDRYFTCSEYADDEGNTYDLDIFFQGKGDDIKPVKTTVHKVNGQARYNWYKKGNVWKTKSVGQGTEGPEHVRH